MSALSVINKCIRSAPALEAAIGARAVETASSLVQHIAPAVRGEAAKCLSILCITRVIVCNFLNQRITFQG